MERVTAGAAIVVIERIVIEADVGQVIETERTIPRHRGPGLGPAGGPGAAVVQAQRRAQWESAPVPDHQVAVAGTRIGANGGSDLDVGIRRGQTFEVLEALFDGAQFQQVAGRHGNGVAQPRRGGRTVVRTHRLDAAGQQCQGQGAGAQRLRPGQHARGRIAPLDQRRLQACHESTDARRSQAAADGRVVVVDTRGV